MLGGLRYDCDLAMVVLYCWGHVNPHWIVVLECTVHRNNTILYWIGFHLFGDIFGCCSHNDLHCERLSTYRGGIMMLKISCGGYLNAPSIKTLNCSDGCPFCGAMEMASPPYRPFRHLCLKCGKKWNSKYPSKSVKIL